jgi:hypothetical protein
VKVRTAGKEKKNLLAPDTRREAGAAAEALEQVRAESRQPVPDRLKAYTVHRIVGKAKKGKKVKVFWKDADSGELCKEDACTWEQPNAFDGDAGKVDAAQLNGSVIKIQEQSIIYQAQVDSGSNESVVTLTYIAREDGATCRKRPRKVDLELPTLETASWWREDGYDTLEEEELSESEAEEQLSEEEESGDDNVGEE